MQEKFFFQKQFKRVLLALLLLAPALVSAQEGSAQPGNDQTEGSDSAAPENRRVRRLGDTESNEWEMDLSIPAGPSETQHNTGYDLPDEEQNQQLQGILSTLATRPGDKTALSNLDALLSDVLNQADQLATLGQLDEMQHLLGVVRNVNPQQDGLSAAFQKLQDLRNIGSWLLAASQAMENDHILEPEGRNALHFLDQVFAIDPDNQLVKAGLLRSQRILINRALEAARELDFESAEEWLYEASLVREPQDLVEEAQEEVSSFQLRQVDNIEQQISDAIDAKDFDRAEFVMIDLIALIGNDTRVQNLRKKLSAARIYGLYSPGEVIRDGLRDVEGTGPAVVVIKAGSFLMGSPDNERDRNDNEGPQHRVTITRGFAMGVHEVTVAQFRQFVEESRYRTQAETVGNSRVYDEGSARIAERDGISWQHDYEGAQARDNDPVIHVDWYDAQAYVSWLSKQTGHNYRLPTEAEFEYAIRAGSVSPYWWGNDRPEELVENLTGGDDESSSGRRWTTGFRNYDDGYWGPAPAASFKPNSLGIYDLAGNVSEWIEDCWHQTYTLAPTDGSAWVNPGCKRRVVRGGYWASSKDQTRSAARISANVNLHGPRVGFRVARDLWHE
jgi:formylglycine-generating enzyme required for sulfatase activity